MLHIGGVLIVVGSLVTFLACWALYWCSWRLSSAEGAVRKEVCHRRQLVDRINNLLKGADAVAERSAQVSNAHNVQQAQTQAELLKAAPSGLSAASATLSHTAKIADPKQPIANLDDAQKQANEDAKKSDAAFANAIARLRDVQTSWPYFVFSSLGCKLALSKQEVEAIKEPPSISVWISFSAGPPATSAASTSQPSASTTVFATGRDPGGGA